MSHDSTVCASQILLWFRLLRVVVLCWTCFCVQVKSLTSFVDYAHMSDAEINTKYQCNMWCPNIFVFQSLKTVIFNNSNCSFVSCVFLKIKCLHPHASLTLQSMFETLFSTVHSLSSAFEHVFIVEVFTTFSDSPSFQLLTVLLN